MNHLPECIGIRGKEFVQIKPLGSCMVPPQGLKLLKIFSRTTGPISTKHAWEIGIQIYYIKKLVPFEAQ